MNFLNYLGDLSDVTDRGLQHWIDQDLIQVAHHDTFPLSMYTYTRKAVYEHHWDKVTSKCRGIIVNDITMEIVARPFEKFHNYGSEAGSGPAWFTGGEPVIWEKMDGFMCTAYTWEGRNYIASKGSFHSPHAKWATAEFNRAIVAKGYTETGGSLREGYTLVFEGLNRDLRIVVDYGKREELVLLAVIDNETGEELNPKALQAFAHAAGFSTPKPFDISLATAARITMATGTGTHGTGNAVDEGFVLTWYREGTTPFRLKLKYVEYLRLHRLVTGMSPKSIWETLSQGLDTTEFVENSTPWFKEFFEKWQRAFMTEYVKIQSAGKDVYAAGLDAAGDWDNHGNLGQLRKAFATAVTTPENLKYSSIAFAMLDGKDLRPIIWKRVKGLARNAHTLRDATQ